MLPGTNVVPSGTVSLIMTSLLKPPLFVTVIVYFIVSPSRAYPTSGCSISTVFSLEIIGSTYWSSVSFVFGSSESPTVALFLINVALFKLFTVTVKLTLALFPAGTSTEIPCSNSSSVYVLSVFI